MIKAPKTVHIPRTIIKSKLKSPKLSPSQVRTINNVSVQKYRYNQRTHKIDSKIPIRIPLKTIQQANAKWKKCEKLHSWPAFSNSNDHSRTAQDYHIEEANWIFSQNDITTDILREISKACVLEAFRIRESSRDQSRILCKWPLTRATNRFTSLHNNLLSPRTQKATKQPTSSTQEPKIESQLKQQKILWRHGVKRLRTDIKNPDLSTPRWISSIVLIKILVKAVAALRIFSILLLENDIEPNNDATHKRTGNKEESHTH
jgi:hypothetical protein